MHTFGEKSLKFVLDRHSDGLFSTADNGLIKIYFFDKASSMYKTKIYLSQHLFFLLTFSELCV